MPPGVRRQHSAGMARELGSGETLGQRGRASWLTARPRGLQVPSARCLRTRCQPRQGGREQLCRVPAPYQQQQPLGARPSACALPHSRTGKPWRSPLRHPASTARSSPAPSHAPAPLIYFQHRHVGRPLVSPLPAAPTAFAPVSRGTSPPEHARPEVAVTSAVAEALVIS